MAEPARTAAPEVTRLLLDCVDDAILVVTEDLAVRYGNHAALSLVAAPGRTPSIDDLDPLRLVHPDDLAAAGDAVARAVAEGRSVVRIRLRLPMQDRPVEVSLTDHSATPGIDGVVASFRNLEHELELTSALERQRHLDDRIRLALTDELTGLPMRRLFLDRLGASLRDADEQGRSVAVFFVDLDGFKAINDALGHSAGDAMLRSTTRRLLSAHGDIDHWGRIGGDEFVLFVDPCEPAAALELAQRISESLRQSIVLGGRSFYTSAAIGLTVVDQVIDAEAAVRRADIAMYQGKRIRRNAVTVFSPDMEQRVVIRAELEHQLRATLTGAGPQVVYQPIVDLRSGRTVAVEALARWHSPTQGSIGPDRFIPMAESMGVIDQLDRHVLRKACRAIAAVREPATDLPLDLTVNASTMHLSNADFALDIMAILHAECFAPSRLILEVTESIAIEDDARLNEQLQILRAAGVRVAIDDFGSGHSSLAQLENLAVDLVKVDRTFLDEVPESGRRLRYIETIIQMANALELRVIFEGIERVEQAQALSHMGVALGQGYLLAEPGGIRDLGERLVHADRVVRHAINVQPHWQPQLRWGTGGA